MPTASDWRLGQDAVPDDYYVKAPAPLDGFRDTESVRAALARSLGTLGECYERRLRDAPALGGVIGAHWTIGPNGRATEVCITLDQVQDAALRACVNAIIEGTQFAVPEGGTLKATHAFVFKRGC